MFGAIESTLKASSPEVSSGSMARAKVVQSNEALKAQQMQQPAEKKEAQTEQAAEASQEMLETLTNDLDMLHHVGLQFSVHETTGRTMIKVINKDTNDLIREIPPEGLLNLAAKMQEMLGILFDKKV
ncbi:MAG: flagellar protein FlaG [Desulfobacterales bacterium]|nr:flagellar protein FlaG [Desulfobacterales bacterium]MDJ0914016.1 flagellar protein FlaG [Desulfobacterales bacterium]